MDVLKFHMLEFLKIMDLSLIRRNVSRSKLSNTKLILYKRIVRCISKDNKIFSV